MNDGPPAARPPEAGVSAPAGLRAGFAPAIPLKEGEVKTITIYRDYYQKSGWLGA